MEFMFVVSVLIVLSLVFYIIYQGQKINLFQTESKLTTEKNAYSLAAAINYVYLAGPGTEYNFTLSENVTVSDLAVQSNRTYSTSHAPLLSSDINTTIIERGEIVIKNNNGAIEIEQ